MLPAKDDRGSTRMNTDQRRGGSFQGLHSDLSTSVLGVFFDVYNELGSGFFESVYQRSFEIALRQAGLRVQSQVVLPVYFRGVLVSEFKADLIVDCKILLELKAVSVVDETHHAQVLNYLKATDLEVGYLLNFGSRPEFKRFVFDNEQKKIRVDPRESVVRT